MDYWAVRSMAPTASAMAKAAPCRAHGCARASSLLAALREKPGLPASAGAPQPRESHSAPVRSAKSRVRKGVRPAQWRPPIGAMLCDGGRYGIVRARLIGIADRLDAAEKAVDEHPRTGTGIAVDHQNSGIGQCRLQRGLGA